MIMGEKIQPIRSDAGYMLKGPIKQGIVSINQYVMVSVLFPSTFFNFWQPSIKLTCIQL